MPAEPAKNIRMQIKIFTIPVVADERDVEDLNHFLRSHKVIDMKRELTTSNDNSCWTFCITYMPDSSPSVQRSGEGKREKIDYKEVLEPAAFERFAQNFAVIKQGGSKLNTRGKGFDVNVGVII